MVVTDFGSTTAAQRVYLAEVLAGQPLRAAILSANPTLRHDGNALSWITRDTRFFDADEASERFAHIPLGRRERAQVRRAIQALQINVKTKTVARIEPWLSG